MPEELGAVLDAPELEVIADDVANEGLDGTPADVVDPSAVPEPKEEVAGDWRKVPAELKEFFKTPAGKAAKDAWFERNAYKEKFPEGIKQVNELTAFLEEHGGREGLTTTLGEMQGKAAELDALSERIANASPDLITDLPPETISKLGPVMDQQWQKSDPEGWTAHVSGVMAATIQQNGVPMFLEKMGMMLEFGKIEDATKMVGQLKEWANGFQVKAQAPKAEVKGAPDKYAAREQELNTREQRAFEGEVEKEVESFRSTQIAKELDSFIKRRPNDTDAKELAINTVRSQVLQRLHADEGFKKSVQALLSRKDKAGAAKLIKSRETAAITEIAPKVGRTIFGNPGVPKAAEAAKPVAQKTPAKPTGRVDPRDAIFDRILGR
jgi:hypothetical protein